MARLGKIDPVDIEQEFIGVVEALLAAGVDFAVCGGFAMALHGFPRYTKDIDLLVDDADVEHIVELVKPCGFDFDAGDMTFQHLTVHRVNKIVGKAYLTLDLLIAERSVADVWNSRVIVDWKGRKIPAVSAVGLARMKRLAARPQDLVDLERMGFSTDDPAIQP